MIQQFQPGTDFDWSLLLGSSGSINIPGRINMDLSHTLIFTYAGPAGTTTTSVSGAFNYFEVTGVPEPTTMLLFGSGLLGVIRASRRKNS